MRGYIYLTKCLVDDMMYIGKHKSETFDKNYIGSGTDLQKHIELYGRDKFICIPLKWCDLEELSDLEERFLKTINVKDHPLFLNKSNKTSGVHTHSKETKDKISKKSAAVWNNPEFVKRSIASRKLSWSTDTDRKSKQSKVMSEVMKDQWADPETRARRSEINRNSAKSGWAKLGVVKIPSVQYPKEIVKLCRATRLDSLSIFSSPSSEKFLGTQREAETYFKLPRRLIREGISDGSWTQTKISIEQLLAIIHPTISRAEVQTIFLGTQPNT